MEGLFSVKFSKDTDWEMRSYHFHNDCEILFVTGGECECLVGAELIRLRRGTVLPLRVTDLHKTNQARGREYERYVLHFSPDRAAAYSTPQTDLLRCFQGEGGFIQLDEQNAAEMARLFEECRERSGGYGSDVRSRNVFFELLVRLGEMAKTEGKPQKISSKSFTRVKPILAYIVENTGETLTLDRIAAEFHFNRQYLCRIFKKTTGVSVGEYVTSVRIQRACLLLLRGYPVQRCGEEAGFVNNSAFITAFGKRVGMSPGKYKKNFAGSALVADADADKQV